MSTRETQKLILDSAIELFNEHGSPNVSTNRIAEHCGISKGNLNYHFRVKSEIIVAVFGRINDEINYDWYDDSE
jgi:AcrR family transcriptional regulator